MLKNILFVFMILAAVACGNKETETLPPDLLDKNKMAEVMTDLGLAESIIAIKTIQDPAFNPDSTLKFNVFKQHNITRKQYENNISYYSAHPKEFKEIYDQVAKNIEGIKK